MPYKFPIHYIYVEGGIFVGFLGNIWKKLGDMYLEQYGIKHPRDAVNFFDRLISSDIDDQEKLKLAKQVIQWLQQTELSGSSYANEARDVLSELRRLDKIKYRNFFKNNKNRINL